MTTPVCGAWIDLIAYGYGWIGVCTCGYLVNVDKKKDMERFDAR